MKYIFRIFRIVRALRSAIIPMAALGYLVISCWSPQGTLDRCDGRSRAVDCPQKRTAAIRKNCCGPRLKGVHYEDIYSSGVI